MLGGSTEAQKGIGVEKTAYGVRAVSWLHIAHILVQVVFLLPPSLANISFSHIIQTPLFSTRATHPRLRHILSYSKLPFTFAFATPRTLFSPDFPFVSNTHLPGKMPSRTSTYPRHFLSTAVFHNRNRVFRWRVANYTALAFAAALYFSSDSVRVPGF